MRPIQAVYIIHLDSPFKHASHYVGWSEFVPARFEHHKAGDGSSLLRAVNEAGINYHISALYIGADRTYERALHNAKNTALYCPICAEKSGRIARTFRPHGYVVTRPRSRAYKSLTDDRYQVANLYEDRLKLWQFREAIRQRIPLVCSRPIPEPQFPF